MHEIIPSPGTENHNWEEIEEKIEHIKSVTQTLHVDVVGGKFAPHKTFDDPKAFSKYKDSLLLEVHLMVEEPIDYLQKYADAGFTRFIGQVEKMADQIAFVAKGQELGEVGLAIDATTELDAIQIPYDDLDCFLVMTIHAGKSGQEMMPELLEKVKRVRKKTHELKETSKGLFFPIEVDGGINDKTIEKAFDAGASRFVVTSGIFSHDNPQKAFKHLDEMLRKEDSQSRV